MLYHPTTIILTSVIALIISFQHNRVFNIIALLLPIVSAAIFFNFAENSSLEIANLTFSYGFNNYDTLISISFFCVLFAARKFEEVLNRMTSRT